MGPVVYIMANKRLGTIYTGVTGNVAQRAWQHREGLIKGFSKTYGTKMLVYFELHQSMVHAIQREHKLKHWPRRWKVELIEGLNPQWDDLYPTLIYS